MYITGAFFCINLCLGITQSIAYSFQKSWLTTFSNCLVSCFSVVVILLLISTNVSADLVLFAMVNGICTTIPNIILIFILKHQGINIFKAISSKNIDKNLRGSIMNAGLQFLGLQICSIVLYSTDNLIINYLISSEMVTKYSIITKIYDTGSSLFAILLISLWSAVTFHIAQNDYEWVRKKIKDLLKILIAIQHR
jgi:O-antigen/teichoic acid export membrane protein